MKKFAFSLQKVLEYKIHMQKNEKDLLRAMQVEQEVQSALLAELREKYEHLKQDYLAKCDAGISAADMALRRTYLSELQKKIAFQTRKVAEMSARIDVQVEKLLAVTKEKTTMEKLRERHLGVYGAKERKEEERFIEEFVSNVTSA